MRELKNPSILLTPSRFFCVTMKQYKIYKKGLVTFALLALLLGPSMPIGLSTSTTLAVAPSYLSVNGGDVFNINVTISNVTNLKGWEFKLYYKRSIVNCTGIIEGPFLQSGGSTFPVFQFNNTYNATCGRVLAACTLLGLGTSVSGSGTLATVIFTAIGSGDTALNLTDTKLAGPGDPPPPIDHTSTDGSVHVAPAMRVDPQISSVSVGSSFNTNVTVFDVTNLKGWEFKLYYQRSILNCTGIIEGPFLQSVGPTFTAGPGVDNGYNATFGRIFLGCSLLGYNVSASGSGVILVINFKAVGVGDTSLNLADTKLAGQGDPPPSIPHSSSDGIVHVTSPPHDLGVLSVDLYKNIIGKSYSFNIEVTVLNEGAYTETFDLSIYANSTQVARYTIIGLDPGKNITVTFNMLTAIYVKGKYSIWAYVWPVTGETHTSDNTIVGGWVLISIPGDVNGDKTVNVLDLILVAIHLGHTNGDGHAKFSKQWYDCMNTDINGDNRHDVLDLIIVAGHLGQTWS